METHTIASQRETELILLQFLKKYKPEVYALWRLHPDYEGDDRACDDGASHTRSTDGDEWEDLDAANGSQRKAESHGDPDVDESPLTFYRRKHMEYLLDRKLVDIPGSSQGLYPAQPWLAYWCLQAADVLGITSQLLARVGRDALVIKLIWCLSDVGQDDERRARALAPPPPPHQEEGEGEQESHTRSEAQPSSHTARVMRTTSAFPQPSPVDFSRPCVSFSGGAREQMPHMATSYAACCALAILTDCSNDSQSRAGHDSMPLSSSSIPSDVLRQLPRAGIKRWLMSVRHVDGSFRMHWGGESDVRASYCAAVITRLLRLDEPDTFAQDDSNEVDDVRFTPVLNAQTAEFVASCQTHEGGFACNSYASEAHGAYTQCAMAAALLMHSTHLCDLARLRRWLAARQLAFEGGFNGRTNKLVDSCYCHWVGASHVLLRVAEAHNKVFGHSHARALRGEPEVPLTAREVCLLHHAQLLDAHSIVCQDVDAWDREESRVLGEADTTDFFLDANDRTKRAAMAKLHARAAFSASLMPTAGAMRDATTDVAKRTAAKEADKAFYDAEVGDFYFNQRKLQLYVLACCQSKEEGGLMDKPDTAHDTYHTCYSLSGVCQAQNLHYASLLANLPIFSAETRDVEASGACAYLTRALEKGYVPKRKAKALELAEPASEDSFGVVLGIRGASSAADVSMLRATNPIFNLNHRRVISALSTFGPKTFI